MKFLAAFGLSGTLHAPVASAADTWAEVQSPHFTVAGNGKRKRIAKSV